MDRTRGPDERGVALLIVLVVLFIVAVLMLDITLTPTTARRAAANASSDFLMDAAVEANLQVALAQLRYDFDPAKKVDSPDDRWAREEFTALCARRWPEREFDKLGYLRIKGARRLDATALAILRELYFVRDARAREIDRPPFKVLGNRTLLDIAERKPGKLAELAEIKGITELLLRRIGREIMAAVRTGRREPHGPIPKLGGGRRRIDRQAERRLAALKSWRAAKAAELSMDPGVLCPNSALEAIAWRAPRSARDLAELDEIKGWFRSAFGAEVAEVANAVGPGGDAPGGAAPRSRP